MPDTGIATKDLCVYALRTNQRFTLSERPLKRADQNDFATGYGSKYERIKRVETERFHRYGYDELARRDKLNLDLFWLQDAQRDRRRSVSPPG